MCSSAMFERVDSRLLASGLAVTLASLAGIPQERAIDESPLSNQTRGHRNVQCAHAAEVRKEANNLAGSTPLWWLSLYARMRVY